MNVWLLSDAIQPPLTGIGRYVYELAAGLQSHDKVNRVELVSYRGRQDWGQIESRCRAADRQAGKVQLRARQDRLARTRGWLINQRLVSAAYETAQEMHYRRALRNENNCVIHGPNYHLPAHYPTGNAAVVTVHDLSTELFPHWHPDLRVQRMKRALRIAISRAQLVLVDASSTAVELIERFQVPESKVKVVPLGVDRAFSRVPLSLPRRYTLCVSTIEPRKNIEALLAAYRTLPDSLKREYPLLLAGGYGWKSDATLQTIRQCVGEGWLKYLGYVSQTELLGLYSEAAVVAYPSLHEGFGLPVLEAMASGCRVVAGNHSSIPEIAGGLACLVDVSDTAELAHALRLALEEPWNEAAAIARRTHASGFTWEATVAATVASYQIAKDNLRP